MTSTRQSLCMLVAISTVLATSLAGGVNQNLRQRETTEVVRCRTLKRHIQYEHGTLNPGPDTVWECEMLDGSSGDILPLEGLDMIDSPDVITEFKSGVTEISIPGGIVREFSIVIPPSTTIHVDNSKQRMLEEGSSRRLMEGTRRVLAVRVIDKDGVATTSTPGVISDKIFGNNGNNLVSQYSACSYGKLRFVPTRALNGNDPSLSAVGVYEVKIPVSVNNLSESTVRAHVVRQLRADFADTGLPSGYTNHQTDASSPFNHVMLCLPPGTSGGWIASGYENSWLSTFNDRWCNYLSAQMHEIGHNIQLEHSGNGFAPSGSAHREYGDQSGVMGSLYGQENGPLMCFNGAKSWQLGWYDDKAVTVTPFSSSWSGRVSGVADYKNSKVDTVVLKIETGTDEDYFLNFNARKGINSGTRANGNQVLVTKQGTNGVGYSVSSLVATMTSGKSFTIPNFGGSGRPVYVNVARINLYASPPYADVSVEMGCTADNHCQRDAMFACSSYCNSRTNTCEMKSGCDCDFTCNSRTEDMFQCPSDCLDATTLETTRAGSDVHDGSMFNIKAKNKVEITRFEIDATDRGTYINAYVYTKVGGYSGHESAKERWTHIQTARIASSGENELTKLPNLPNPIVIPAGGTQAFYITLEKDRMQHTTGQSEGRLYASDDNIEFYEGVGVAYPFGATQSPRIWNGRVNYVEVPDIQLSVNVFQPAIVQPPPTKATVTSTAKAEKAKKRKRRKRRRQGRRRFRTSWL